MLTILDGFEGLGTINKADCPPECSVVVKPVVPVFLCQEYAWDFKAAARVKGGILQASLNMLGHSAHVQHDRFRVAKHLRVDALKDKVLFPCGFQGHQEGIIDITVPEFPDLYDRALRFELFCNAENIVHVFILSQSYNQNLPYNCNIIYRHACISLTGIHNSFKDLDFPIPRWCQVNILQIWILYDQFNCVPRHCFSLSRVRG